MKDSGPPGVSAIFRVVSSPLLLLLFDESPAFASDRPPPSDPPHAVLSMSMAAVTTIHADFEGFIRSPPREFVHMPVGVGAHTLEMPRRPVRALRLRSGSMPQRREQLAAEASELGQGLGRDLVARPGQVDVGDQAHGRR